MKRRIRLQIDGCFYPAPRKDPATATLVAAVGLTAMSTIAGGQAQKAAGQAQQKSLEYQATLQNAQASALEQRAGQERASAQRAQIEQRRQGDLVSSRARALSAAGGGDTLDPTVTDIQAGIANETDYRALTAKYQGESAAQGLEYNANLTRAGAAGDIWAGQVARNAGNDALKRSYLSAAANSASLFAKYPGVSDSLLSQGNGLSRYFTSPASLSNAGGYNIGGYQ